MKHFSLIILICISFAITAQTNLSFLGNLTYSEDLSDIWGYAANSKEYALVGVYDGVSIVDITNPSNPNELFFIQGSNTFWRDIKTWNDHAYVTNEGGGGLLIIDLSFLPDSIGIKTWNGGGLGLNTAHNIFIDENGIAYVVGGNSSAGDGALFLDVDTDPMNPTLIGRYDNRYVHDIYVRGDTMWTAEIDDGIFSVVDISNKSNPVVMATSSTPSNYTHNLWLSNDGNNLLTTDELSNAFIGSYNVSDLGNIQLLDTYQSNPGSGVIPHNVFYKGDFAFIAYYRDGIVLLDASNPSNLVKIGNYDSSPQSGTGFNGAWGVYPYLPSGNILATDIEQGLFILGANYIKACYLEGNITEAGSNSPLNGVTVQILNSTTSTTSKITGDYATGIGDSGTYSIQYSKSGYVTHVENNVVLKNGISTTVDVQMVPAIRITLTGQVIDSISGQGIPNAEVRFESINTAYWTTADNNGQFSINQFETGNYTFYAGHWGYLTKAKNISVLASGANVSMRLDSGYYDDFLFDFNWGISGDAATGIWERDRPEATSYNSQPANPGVDITGDYGLECFVTGNGGGQAGNDDVDDGTSILTSPRFNLSTYKDPFIHYYRWFFNDGGSGNPNDELLVKLTNGLDTIVIETIDANSLNSNNWNQHEVRVMDFLPPSENMRLILETSDLASSGHLVEAAIDLFQIVDSNTIFPPQADFTTSVTNACPGSSITFSDLSTEEPNAWTWAFQGGQPAVANDSNPTVIYNTPGTYSVVLTASNEAGSNTTTKNALITIFPNPDLAINKTDVTCNDGSDGSAAAQVVNGQGNYSYQWSNGSQTIDNNNLSAGNYIVTVTDGNSCSAQASANIAEPTAVTISGVTDNALCGNQNGSIALSTSGGTFPYDYQWDTGDTASTMTNLAAGTYQVTVKDANDCLVNRSFSISNENGPTLNYISTDVTCAQNSDGSISVQVSGGTPPFDISWDHGPTTANLFGLDGGDYTIVVTDSNNCLSIQMITINAPTLLDTEIAAENPTCDKNNGTISLTTTGGTPPYAIEWNNGSSLDSLSNLMPGIYSVTILDDNNCVVTNNVNLSNQQGPSSINLLTSTAPSCYSATDGTMSVSPVGGSAPYQYLWSNGTQDNVISNVGAGTYEITITDGNGCSISESYDLDEPDSLMISVSSTSASGFTSQDGSATVFVMGGGTPPYYFSWSTGSTDNNLQNLSAGNYSLTVTDQNNCMATALVTIDIASSIDETFEEHVTLYPNPFSEFVNISLPGKGTANVTISLYNTLGEKLESFETTNSIITWGEHIEQGVYFIIIEIGSERFYAKLIKSK